jgi:hypothetical protein
LPSQFVTRCSRFITPFKTWLESRQEDLHYLLGMSLYP